MANVQHSSLTDPNLHEPKGISSASANQLYLSNGSGSGVWTNANRFPGTGWGKYTNTTYVSPTTLSVSNTAVLLPFTTADTVSQLPITLTGTTSSLMNIATETLQFVAVGDLHSITISLKIDSFGAGTVPTVLDISLFGSSDGTTYGTLLGETSVSLDKGAGQFITESSLFPDTSNMVTHGARIFIKINNTNTANIVDIGLITARVHKAR
jgi:hypothetical protein